MPNRYTSYLCTLTLFMVGGTTRTPMGAMLNEASSDIGLCEHHTWLYFTLSFIFFQFLLLYCGGDVCDSHLDPKLKEQL